MLLENSPQRDQWPKRFDQFGDAVSNLALVGLGVDEPTTIVGRSAIGLHQRRMHSREAKISGFEERKR